MCKVKTYDNLDKLMAICPHIKSTNYSKYGVIINDTLLIPHFWLQTDRWLNDLSSDIAKYGKEFNLK